MYHSDNVRLLLLAPVFLFLLSACAELKLDPPGPRHQTVLVLPVKFENRAMNRTYYWDFFYAIERSDGTGEPATVRFRLPIDEGMLIVDSLAPGDYSVDRFFLRPKGAADHDSGNTTRHNIGKFSLQQGKITIFSKSLNILIRNETPGRIGEIITSYGISEVSPDQKAEIRERLGKLDNFQSWSLVND